MYLRVCVCVWLCVIVWREEGKERKRLLDQEGLFIYVAIYLNKVHFLNSVWMFYDHNFTDINCTKLHCTFTTRFLQLMNLVKLKIHQL